MGRRGRQRRDASEGAGGTPDPLSAPLSHYPDAQDGELVLRGSLTPASRRRYTEIIGGGLQREDAWQRGVEYLFERLAVGWTVAGVETTRQRELLGRYRMAGAAERRFVREALREHLAEHFPELQAP